MDKKINDIYIKYEKLENALNKFDEQKIPLCAAETYISDFVKNTLATSFEGKYCMGNKYYNEKEDFIGSKYIHDLFDLLSELCEVMFNCKYSDARTLTGMNCMSIIISALLTPKSHVLLTTSDQGGHASIPLLLELSDISFDAVPYDFNKNDLDYEKINKLLKLRKYDAIIFAQSDVILPADVSKIASDDLLFIYDATQTLGMIASKIHKNPLNFKENIVLIGGTHKTLPGPTSGLILVNNQNLIEKLDRKISPSILRNVQPNHIAGVVLALIEQAQFGFEYQTNIIKNANYLGKKLEEKHFEISRISATKYTDTHQLFICTTQKQMETIYNNALKFGITLNKKVKSLFKGFGIRIGLQEVTRYGWKENELDLVSEILYQISLETPDLSYLDKITKQLILNKTNRYVFDDLLIK